MKDDCLTCKYFTSFRDNYFDDLEPDDEGFCSCDDSPYYGNEGAGIGVKCDFYKKEKGERRISNVRNNSNGDN